MVARLLAGPTADVAGPAGLAARRRDSGELSVRSWHGRRGDRSGTHEARGPDFRCRAGLRRAPARVHECRRRQAPRGAVHPAFPLGIQLSFPRSPANVRVDYRTRAVLYGAEPAADRPERLHRPGLRWKARGAGEDAASSARASGSRLRSRRAGSVTRTVVSARQLWVSGLASGQPRLVAGQWWPGPG